MRVHVGDNARTLRGVEQVGGWFLRADKGIRMIPGDVRDLATPTRRTPRRAPRRADPAPRRDVPRRGRQDHLDQPLAASGALTRGRRPAVAHAATTRRVPPTLRQVVVRRRRRDRQLVADRDLVRVLDLRVGGHQLIQRQAELLRDLRNVSPWATTWTNGVGAGMAVGDGPGHRRERRGGGRRPPMPEPPRSGSRAGRTARARPGRGPSANITRDRPRARDRHPRAKRRVRLVAARSFPGRTEQGGSVVTRRSPVGLAGPTAAIATSGAGWRSTVAGAIHVPPRGRREVGVAVVASPSPSASGSDQISGPEAAAPAGPVVAARNGCRRAGARGGRRAGRPAQERRRPCRRCPHRGRRHPTPRSAGAAAPAPGRPGGGASQARGMLEAGGGRSATREGRPAPPYAS